MTYKRAELGSLKATLTKHDGTSSMVLLDEPSPLKVHITTKKNARTSVMMSNKIEVKMRKFHVNMTEGDGSLGLVVHFLLGVAQCFLRGECGGGGRGSHP